VAITDVIYLPNGLIHMELLHSDDMVIIEYILYAYNYNNQIIKEYKSDNTYINYFYYESGELLRKNIYIDTKLSGSRQEWHKNGQLSLIFNYKDGKRNGLSERWYPNGQINLSANYKDNERDGLYEEWYENGQLKFSCKYKDNKLDGFLEEWYEDGKLVNLN
jgi:antitoxin component YwqK of YwqJK toxin-antitoxin module